jgi:hypothetical protein
MSGDLFHLIWRKQVIAAFSLVAEKLAPSLDRSTVRFQNFRQVNSRHLPPPGVKMTP